MTKANLRSKSRSAPLQKIRLLIECLVIGFDGTELYLMLNGMEGNKLPFISVASSQSLSAAAHEFAKNNLEQEEIFIQQVYSCDEVKDVNGQRSFFVTYLYCVCIDRTNTTNGREWIRLSALKGFELSIQKKVHVALRQMQSQFTIHPGKLTLLPEKFTISQLCRMYETIFSREIDVRNFRKMIFATKTLTRLNEKERASSRRGAFYYRFKKKASVDSFPEDDTMWWS